MSNMNKPAFRPKKVCVAYSGGLDTSCIIPWLVETYGCQVVACVADVGQGARELEGIEEKAKRTGAVECIVVDASLTQRCREAVFAIARVLRIDARGQLRRVASGPRFDVSGYTAGLQPYFQIQKSSDSNTDALTILQVSIEYRLPV
jgi:hypothetical protein